MTNSSVPIISEPTISSKEQQAQACAFILPITPETGGAVGYASAPPETELFRADLGLPDFFSRLTPVRNPPPLPTTRERLCAKERMPLEKPYPNTRSRASRLHNPYYQAELHGIRDYLLNRLLMRKK